MIIPNSPRMAAHLVVIFIPLVILLIASFFLAGIELFVRALNKSVSYVAHQIMCDYERGA